MSENVISKNERILTVYEFLTPSYEKDKYSRIMIQGKWLRDLGFITGKKVSVKTLNDNKLLVSLID